MGASLYQRVLSMRVSANNKPCVRDFKQSLPQLIVVKFMSLR